MSEPLVYRECHFTRTSGILSEIVGIFVIGIPSKAIEEYRQEHPTDTIDAAFAAAPRQATLLLPRPGSLMIFRMGAGDSRVNIGQGDPLIAQDEFAHLVGVFHTARFDDAEHAIPFPSLTDVREVNPSVRNCRDLPRGTKLLRAEHTGERERLRTLDDLDASALRLREICLIVLDWSYTDSELRAAIFTRISREQLEKDVATIGALSREDHGNYFEHLCNPTTARFAASFPDCSGRFILRATERVNLFWRHWNF
jgi:hypothetical protein